MTEGRKEGKGRRKECFISSLLFNSSLGYSSSQNKAPLPLLPFMMILLVFSPLLVVSASAQGMYEGTDVIELTEANFKAKVIESDFPWMVEFYAPWCGHCQRLKPDYIKAASSSKGIVRFGAINCDDHKGLATQYNIRGFPTLKIFGKKKKSPEDYNGARSAKAMSEAVILHLPNLVTSVTSKSISEFLSQKETLPKALLFTSKSTTTPLYKALALDLKGRMDLGEVRSKKESGLLKHYGVDEESLPALIVVPVAKLGEKEGTEKDLPRYSGELKHKPLLKFLSEFAPAKTGKCPMSGKEKAKGETKAGSEGKTGSPKTDEIILKHARSASDLDAFCLKLKRGFCVIAFLPGPSPASEIGSLTLLASKYASDPLVFVWIDATSTGATALKDSLSIESVPSAVVINIKRNKFSLVDGISRLEGVLDRALGGDLAMPKRLGDGWHLLLGSS